MRIGIYNRWLATMGGGERHMLAMAELLSVKHDVEVISHQLVSKRDLEKKLNVDLEKVELVCVPMLPCEENYSFTKDYDLFINASFRSTLPSQAPKSLLLVYFPDPLELSPWIKFKMKVGLWLKRQLMVPDYVEGFFDFEEMGEWMIRWTGEEALLRIHVPPRLKCLRLRLLLGRPEGPPEADVSFLTDSRQVSSLHLDGKAPFKFHDLHLEVDSRPLLLEIRTDTFDPSLKDSTKIKRELGVALAAVKPLHLRYRLFQFLFGLIFRNKGLKLLGLLPYRQPDFVESYDEICANSHFTSYWIKRFWGKDSKLFQPPVEVEAFKPLPKRNIILSVGRFFVGGHNKKHIPMIRAFKKLLKGGLRGWELHLAGGTVPEKRHLDYLQRVKKEASGYPIYIHTDANFAELTKLYGQAKIYWHACGYGENVERNPMRFEHFGITTVEAMAAGCVPVVINKAGQVETVRHGEDGFLWNSLDELQRYTMRLIEDEALWQKMSQTAMEHSRQFGREAFAEKLKEIMAVLGVEV